MDKERDEHIKALNDRIEKLEKKVEELTVKLTEHKNDRYVHKYVPHVDMGFFPG